jgi:hypothetical protein
MLVRLKFLVLAGLLSVTLTGCAGIDLFSCCDRYCYLADWTNHHSCLSCCPHTGCCDPPIVDFTPEGCR